MQDAGSCAGPEMSTSLAHEGRDTRCSNLSTIGGRVPMLQNESAYDDDGVEEASKVVHNTRKVLGAVYLMV